MRSHPCETFSGIRPINRALAMYSQPSRHRVWQAFALLIGIFGFLHGQAKGQSTQSFSTAGNSTWICPTGVTSVQVETWGGGGGGGGTGQSYYADAGGGAGGSYVRATQSVTPGTTYYLTVGAGGAGGTGGAGIASDGATGGSSYFGTSSSYLTSGALVLAVGGPGGAANSTTGSSSSNYSTSVGGTATNNGNVLGSSVIYNYAGTSGSASGNKTSGAGGAGAGATGIAGGGAGGAALTSKANGNPGNAPGGGGSGGQQGASPASASNGAGGAGGAGQIVLTYTSANPTVATTGTLSAVSTGQGTASIPMSFSASGSNLTANITATAPTDFEISTTSSTGYSSSVSLTQSGGTVASTTLYVRLAASDSTGSYSGNVSLASSGATTVNVAIPACNVASPFTTGNLAVEELPTNAGSSTFSIIELSPSTANQSAPVNTYLIPSTGATALRQSNSGSTGRLATSNDGTWLTFTGFADATGATDETSITQRAAAYLDHDYNYPTAFPASYTDSAGAGDQTRGATYNNGTWYMSDKNGIWLSGTTPANSTNIRPIKSFGGTVYAMSASSPAVVVSSVSADGTTLTGLPGLPVDASSLDFHMLSSGVNGNVFDILYVLDGATVTKYSLVGSTWVANGSAAALGVTGDGFCAAGNGSGASLYVTTGATNTVVLITDTAGYNTAPNINTASNVTLYTGPTGAFLKGVALAPLSTALPDLTIAVSAPASAGSSFNYTMTVANSGAASASGITAQFTLPAGLTFVSAANTGSAGFVAPTTAPSGLVTFTGGTLGANTSETLTVSVTTATTGIFTAAAGAAVVNPSKTIAESNPNNDTSNITASTTIASGSIIVSGSPSALSSTYGAASTPTSFTASGAGLTANITVTPPAGFEVSTTSASGYSSSLTLTQSGGTVDATTLYVRLAAATIPGAYSGNVSVTSAGANTQNVAIPSSTVSPRTLTLSGASVTTKPWDGTTAATITGTLVGIISGDTVSLVGTGAFASANDGVGIAVTASCTLSGANASNYTLTQPTGLTGTITASANLGGLVSSAGGFTTAVSAGSTSYTQYVGNNVTSVTLTPTTDTGATVTVNGASASTPISLSAGSNTITVVVKNGSLTQTYTINVIVASGFAPGNLVVTTYGNVGFAPVHSDGQATVISLSEFSPTIVANSTPIMVMPLPSTASGANVGITGEYGTSSESRIQLSSDGQYVTIGGYSAAQAYAYAPNSVPNGALAQAPCATVPRVMAMISASGGVDTSSVFDDIYNTNNPRCVYTPDNTHLYLSGQGAGTGDEGGIYYTTIGTNTTTGGSAPTGIFNGVSTRQVQVYQGNLYYTCDQNSKKGIQTGVYGFTGLPITSATPLTNTGTQITPANNGSGVNYSPDGIFFANANTLYIADTGLPKAGGTGAGGIQKWVNNGSAWVLQYNMTNPSFVDPALAATAAHGETGFESVTGKMVGGVVYLYAVSYTAGDGDPNGLYAITDTLAATTYAGQTFTTMAAAPGLQASGTNPDFVYKGVSFTPAVLAPDLTVAATHTGTLKQGDAADICTITVTNSGSAATTGATLTVTDILPAGLTPAASMNNTSINGWSVTIIGQTVTATRSDIVAAGNPYPSLTLTVSVADEAAVTLSNSVTVSGGGEVYTGNDNAQDSMPIAPSPTNTWKQTYFGTNANTGATADNASYVGDKIPNLMKYALGLNPTLSYPASALPQPVNGSAGTRLVIGFTIPFPAPSDLTYNVQVTSDLVNWTTVATKVGAGAWTWVGTDASQINEVDNAGASTMQIGDDVTVSDQGSRMMRLSVSH